MKSAVNWFEIPVSNIVSAISFYEKVFRCKLKGLTIKEYKLAMFPATEISGALIEEAGHVGPERGTLIYLNIPDTIEGVLERVEKNGGKTVTPRTLIAEDVGWSATFKDPDANIIGLYESV